jgi:hypothetical protein
MDEKQTPRRTTTKQWEKSTSTMKERKPFSKRIQSRKQ